MLTERDGYEGIFDERGASYHRAMTLYPNARRNEFLKPLELADIKPGQVIADFPSGGGYLSSYLQKNTNYICIESSRVFAACCENKGLEVSMLVDRKTSLPANTVDRVISIAGVHHESNKTAVLSEMRRILKPEGLACVADVEESTPVARFLDTVVDEYTSTGHKGSYFSRHTRTEFERAGYCDITRHDLHYHWVFDTTKQMIDYCRLIFALEADDREILHGIETHLGFSEAGNRVLMPWQLMCWVAKADNL